MRGVLGPLIDSCQLFGWSSISSFGTIASRMKQPGTKHTPEAGHWGHTAYPKHIYFRAAQMGLPPA